MAPRELHTFLFADIAGYSLLTELDGDEAAADLAMRFVSDASSIARDHGAEVVKGLGDAVMVHADDADRAVRLALDLLTELGRNQLMLPIHAGLHTGPAVGRLGDWWGATVNIAARVAAAAGPGQILLTEATRAAAGEMDSIRLRELGPLRLKNITLPVKIYAASRVPLARSVAPPRRAPSVFVPSEGPAGSRGSLGGVRDVAGRSRRVTSA